MHGEQQKLSMAVPRAESQGHPERQKCKADEPQGISNLSSHAARPLDRLAAAERTVRPAVPCGQAVEGGHLG